VRLDAQRRGQAVVIGKPLGDRHGDSLSVWLADGIGVPHRGGNARADTDAV
jgi:hypothetical protein